MEMYSYCLLKMGTASGSKNMVARLTGAHQVSAGGKGTAFSLAVSVGATTSWSSFWWFIVTYLWLWFLWFLQGPCNGTKCRYDEDPSLQPLGFWEWHQCSQFFPGWNTSSVLWMARWGLQGLFQEFPLAHFTAVASKLHRSESQDEHSANYCVCAFQWCIGEITTGSVWPVCPSPQAQLLQDWLCLLLLTNQVLKFFWLSKLSPPATWTILLPLGHRKLWS